MMNQPEFEFKAGDKVRIHPAICRDQGLPERGWTVVLTPEGGGYSIVEGHAVSEKKWPRGVTIGWLSLFPDIDLPYDPKPPQKTLAEKELEVLQKDPIRRRWMELLGPQPVTEDFAAEVIRHKREANAEVRKLIKAAQNNPYLPPGEYEVKVDFFPFQPSTDGEGVTAVVQKLQHAVSKTNVKNATAALRVRKDGEFKVGDHVWDRMYSTTPSRKGTVEKAFEGFSSFLVRWADGGASVRQPGTLGHAPSDTRFKRGDHVHRTGAPFQPPGTISALTNLFIEIQWDDGSKTAGAFDSSSNWLEHE